MALALHEEGDRSAADSAHRCSLALYPGHARSWNNPGLLLEESGQLDKARSAYRSGESLKGLLRSVDEPRVWPCVWATSMVPASPCRRRCHVMNRTWRPCFTMVGFCRCVATEIRCRLQQPNCCCRWKPLVSGAVRPKPECLPGTLDLHPNNDNARANLERLNRSSGAPSRDM